MSHDLSEPPERAVDGGTIHFGRYRHPIPLPTFRVPGPFGRYRLKEWCFFSVTTDRCYLAFALVQLGYVGNVFCYLVDRADDHRAWEHETLTPLGAGLRIAPSSVAGQSRFDWRKTHLAVRWTGAWEVQLDVPLSSDGRTERLHGGFRVEPDEALALLHPLRPRRPAYTHKAAGMRVEGLVSFAGEELSLSGGRAALDWTRSAALRDTRWKWASVATTLGDGRRVGLNLSAEVYDDASGSSRENGLWVDGRVIALDGVDFQLPLEPRKDAWHVRGRGEDRIDLRFEPRGARAQRLDLKLVQTDFVQAFGTWHGRVEVGGEAPVVLDGAYGVAEDHFARW